MKRHFILYLLIIGLMSGCQMTGERTPDVSGIEQGESQIMADDILAMAQVAGLIQNENISSPTGSYSVRKLSCERDGLTINGVAYIPNNIEKSPTVIMSHGFNSNYVSNIAYAEILAESGMASYTFDFCGGSTGSISDGRCWKCRY